MARGYVDHAQAPRDEREMRQTAEFTAGIPVAETAQFAASAGLVEDRRQRGTFYVVINPGYASPRGTRQRVLAMRILVCLLCVGATALAAAGTALPYRVGRYGNTKYSVWFYRDSYFCYTSSVYYYYGIHLQCFAALTIVFACVAMSVAAAYASRWAELEKRREAEYRENQELQEAYGEERSEDADSRSTSFPFANTRLPNHGEVPAPPLEALEAARRKKDNDLGIAIFSMLVCTAVCALLSIVFMALYNPYSFSCDDFLSDWGAGFALFLVAFFMSVLALVLIAIPQLTRLDWCCASAAVEPCQLMVVNAHQAQGRAEQYARTLPQQAYARAGIPAALPAPPAMGFAADVQESSPFSVAEQRADVRADAQQAGAKEGDEAYSTAAYYGASHPLAPARDVPEEEERKSGVRSFATTEKGTGKHA